MRGIQDKEADHEFQEPLFRTPNGVAGIKPRMGVLDHFGKKVGIVDEVKGGAIMMSKPNTQSGERSFIPLQWVDWVDQDVHLFVSSSDSQ